MGDLKLNFRRGLLSGLLVCGGPLWAQDGLVSSEASVRAADARDAYSLIEEGDTFYLDGDFATAVDRYASALAKLPDGAPAVADIRSMAVQRFSQTSLVRAQELMRTGDKKGATALLDQVEAVDPNHPKVKQFRAKMDDPIRNNPSLTPGHAANVDRVRRLLYEAEGYYDSGQFDRAYMTYEDILRIDKFNKTARRGMERVNAAKSDYAGVARDQARAEALEKVEGQWEIKVPKIADAPTVGGEDGGGFVDSKADLQEKLNTILIPEIRLTGATLEESVEFLRAISIEEDRTTLDESKRGVPFVVQLGDEDHPAVKKIRAARINLSLNNVPLGEVVKRITEATSTISRVDRFAVVFNAAGFDDPTLIRRSFRVPPDFLTSGALNEAEAPDDPFAANDNRNRGGLIAKKLTARERLQSLDVSFPDGASARYNKGTSTLVVVNTAANIRLVEDIVAELAKTEPLAVLIKTTIIDASQDNLEDLGFDLMAGEIKVGSNGVLSGGTTGNGGEINDMINGRPVTAGNRSGALVPTSEGLDALLNRRPISVPSGVTTSNAGAVTSGFRLPDIDNGAGSRAPGILSLYGVIDDTLFELLMRGLSQKKGTDVMVRPEVATRPGQNAIVESVIEFPYPEDFEPPQIPNAIGGGGAIATPATPTDFTTADLGVTLEVLPQVGPNRKIIQVSVNPVIRDFEGFINYGTPITGTIDNTFLNLVDGTLGGTANSGIITQNAILKPLFRTVRGKTVVDIVDGSTIVIGGYVSEIRKHINDKVPVLGDVPGLGRIFRQDSMSVEKRSVLIFLTVDLTDPAGNLYRDR